MPGFKNVTSFAVNNDLSKAITAGEEITLENITAVMFDRAVLITLDNGQPLPLFEVGELLTVKRSEAYLIDTSSVKFTINIDAYMWAMGGK